MSNQVEYFYNQGNSYRALGQHQLAIKAYEKAIELDPNKAEAYNNRGNSYADLGLQHRAIEDYCKARALAPN